MKLLKTQMELAQKLMEMIKPKMIMIVQEMNNQQSKSKANKKYQVSHTASRRLKVCQKKRLNPLKFNKHQE
jgi:hypothetical protein